MPSPRHILSRGVISPAGDYQQPGPWRTDPPGEEDSGLLHCRFVSAISGRDTGGGAWRKGSQTRCSPRLSEQRESGINRSEPAPGGSRRRECGGGSPAPAPPPHESGVTWSPGDPSGATSEPVGRPLPGGASEAPGRRRFQNRPAPGDPRVLAPSPAVPAPPARPSAGANADSPGRIRALGAAQRRRRRGVRRNEQWRTGPRPDGPRRQRHGSSWHRKGKRGGPPGHPLFPPTPPGAPSRPPTKLQAGPRGSRS